MAKIEKIKLPNTRIKLLQMLLKKAIDEFKKVNRIKGVDFSKRLKQLVDLYNERKDFETYKSEVMDDVAEQLANLFKELQVERNSFIELGINFEEKAFYDILKSISLKYKFHYPEDKLIALSKAIKTIVDDKAKYTDWSKRSDIKAELQVDLILTLDEHGYPPFTQDEVYKEIFEQAENFKKYIDNEIVSIGKEEFTYKSKDIVSFHEFILSINFEEISEELLLTFKGDLSKVLQISPEDMTILGIRPGSTELLLAIKNYAVTIPENIDALLSNFSILRFITWSKENPPNIQTFISYSSKDRLLVQGVYFCLKAEKLEPWMDVHELMGGDNWDYQIFKALHSSTSFVFCLSNNSLEGLKKRETLFKELIAALEKAKQIGPEDNFVFPLRLDNCNYHPLITKYQTLDWDADQKKLVISLRKSLKHRKIIQ